MAKKVYPILITIFLFLAIYITSSNVPEESIRTFLNKFGVLTPVIFIFLLLITYIFAPLSGIPLLFAGFYAFGINVVWLTTVTAFISSIINFWIAKRWGRSIVRRLIGSEDISKIDNLTKNYGLLSLFFLRVLGGGIHEFVSYAAGLTLMTFSAYLVISTVGMVPGMILWYFLALNSGSPLIFIILTLVLVTILSAIFVIAKFVHKKIRK